MSRAASYPPVRRAATPVVRPSCDCDERGDDAGEQARIEAFGILVDELVAIREVAAEGRTSVDAKPEHAASGLWPCVHQMLELLGFSVRNVINSRMERQGATIFWDEV